ncbi:23S rRNA (pseudouridine(1915)-N(3))-methyltransferase RlmH [uncultured Veillonella sp.]|uniref:23S rRNA (pseudouridine(1915)-N(3))-methyltransferase RlmH n=1 Tax=uncultured Veillonella sp. TaxID=159268 RepID=UPI00261E2FD8|nr:23S rRNA (pseudouridine(1915)-N(3))-methyltransferase RlmH [uncultured Veillonella sp.]
MKFTIITIGKLKTAYLREGVEEFVKRLAPYGGATIIELNESKQSSHDAAQRAAIVEEEGSRVMKQIANKAFVVLLDVKGKSLSSEELAATIQRLEVDGISEMTFVIGGAFGVSKELRQRANLALSFSAMTFTHQMVRLLLVEQLYRACKINRNEPYHW